MNKNLLLIVAVLGLVSSNDSSARREKEYVYDEDDYAYKPVRRAHAVSKYVEDEDNYSISEKWLDRAGESRKAHRKPLSSSANHAVIQHLKNELKMLEEISGEQLASCERDLVKKEKEILEVKKDIAQKDADLLKAKEAEVKQQKELKDKDQKIAKLTAQTQDLTQKLATVDAQREQYHQYAQELQAYNQRLEQTLASAQQMAESHKFDQLRLEQEARNKDLNAQVELTENELRKVRAELASVKRQASAGEQATEELGQLREELSHLKNEVKSKDLRGDTKNNKA